MTHCAPWAGFPKPAEKKEAAQNFWEGEGGVLLDTLLLILLFSCALEVEGWNRYLRCCLWYVGGGRVTSRLAMRGFLKEE